MWCLCDRGGGGGGGERDSQNKRACPARGKKNFERGAHTLTCSVCLTCPTYANMYARCGFNSLRSARRAACASHMNMRHHGSKIIKTKEAQTLF